MCPCWKWGRNDNDGTTRLGWAGLGVLLVIQGCAVDQGSEGRSRAGLSTPTDHHWAFERGDPPEPERTVEQVQAGERFEELLTELEDRSGDPLRAWSAASPEELAEAASASRAFHDRDSTHRAASDLSSITGLSSARRDAVLSLARGSVQELSVRWHDEMGSPARLGGVGFVERDSDPRAVWRAFVARSSADLQALFGPDGRCTKRITDVRTDDLARFHHLWIERRCDGLPVPGQWMAATITGDANRAGPGLLTQIEARWLPGLELWMPVRGPSDFITDVQALTSASAPAGAFVESFVECGAGSCTPVRHVHVSESEVVAIDALGGTVVRRWDPRHHAGPIYIGSFPPGATSLTPVRYRGANVIDFYGTYLGYTSLANGTYSLASGSSPYIIGHAGGMPSTTWPVGRVDRRTTASWNTLQASNVFWTQSSQPTRDFGNPDSWPPSSSQLWHVSEITYGWLSYFQHLMQSYVGVQIADTVSFQANAGGPGLGNLGCQTATLNAGAPGSGQGTWGRIACGWGTGDNVGTPMNDMGLTAHEYGHNIGNCAATAGSSCTNLNPGTQSFRPPTWQAWKRQVWGAYVENYPNMVSTLLTEFTDANEGGYGIAFQVYRPAWRYGGYLDTTDNFGTATEDSASGINCNDPSTPCPTGYTCVSVTDESPLKGPSPPAPPPGGGICAKACTTTANCVAAHYCINPVWAPGSVCWHDDYTNAWFTTMGPRLAADAGWRHALRNVTDAGAGASANGTRDFNLGSDTWHDAMISNAIGTFTRFEVTRSVRSVTDEPGVTAKEDFADRLESALPITVIDTNGTPFWWGNGPYAYPNFEDLWDVDAVMFRGTAGQSYTVTANPIGGSAADLSIYVYRWSAGLPLVASGHAPAGPTATVSTGTLSSTDWYAVAFVNRSLYSGAYYGYVKLSTGSDDFAGTASEAYPMPSGITEYGTTGSYDSDTFQMYVPTTSTTLTVTATSSPPMYIYLRRPNGTLAASGYNSVAVTPSVAGQWTWEVKDWYGSTRTYSTVGTLSCATWSAGSCDDLTGAPAIATRYGWGDRFAGRLPTGSSTADYSIYLNEEQHAVFSLAHNSTNNCRLQLDLIGPSSLSYFNGNRIWRWLDLPDSGGAASGDPTGDRLGAGGHVQAPAAGTYRLVVSSSNGGAECHYRIFMGEGPHYGTARPSW